MGLKRVCHSKPRPGSVAALRWTLALVLLDGLGTPAIALVSAVDDSPFSLARPRRPRAVSERARSRYSDETHAPLTRLTPPLRPTAASPGAWEGHLQATGRVGLKCRAGTKPPDNKTVSELLVNSRKVKEQKGVRGRSLLIER